MHFILKLFYYLHALHKIIPETFCNSVDIYVFRSKLKKTFLSPSILLDYHLIVFTRFSRTPRCVRAPPTVCTSPRETRSTALSAVASSLRKVMGELLKQSRFKESAQKWTPNFLSWICETSVFILQFRNCFTFVFLTFYFTVSRRILVKIKEKNKSKIRLSPYLWV